MPHIRPIAICLFRHNGRILVFEGYDPSKDKTFYRPLGGGIEFGEYSGDAIQREIREELNAEVHDLVYLGTLENIFTFDGQPGHEIVQVYDGKLNDPELYEKTEIAAHEPVLDLPLKVSWRRLDEFGPGKLILYPDGLLELLLLH